MPRLRRRGHQKRGEDVPIDRMTIDEMAAELREWRDNGYENLDHREKWHFLKRTGDLQHAIDDARIAEMNAGPMSRLRVAYWLRTTGNGMTIAAAFHFWNRRHEKVKPNRKLLTFGEGAVDG